MDFKKEIIFSMLILSGCEPVSREPYSIKNYTIEQSDIIMESCDTIFSNNKEYLVWRPYPILQDGNSIDIELSDKTWTSPPVAIRFRSANNGCVLMSFTLYELKKMRDQGLEPVLTNDGIKIMSHHQTTQLPHIKQPLKNGLCLRILEGDEKYLSSQKCITYKNFIAIDGV